MYTDLEVDEVQTFHASDHERYGKRLGQHAYEAEVMHIPGELPAPDKFQERLHKRKHGIILIEGNIVRQVMDRNYIREHLEYGQGISQEYRNNHGIYGETRIVRIDENTVIIAFAEKHQAIIERKNKIYKDSLTLVNNRKYYDDYLEIQLCQALVMADIDHFKDINDHFGHLCGDAALAAVANALQSNVRGSDVVVRYGGDEFLIIFKNISEDVLRNRMEQMRKAVTEITLDKYPNVSLSMSFGVTYGNGKIKDMLETADELMYEAKKMRNSILFKAF